MRRSVGVSEGEEVRNERDLLAGDNRERLRLKAAVRASEVWSSYSAVRPSAPTLTSRMANDTRCPHRRGTRPVCLIDSP